MKKWIPALILIMLMITFYLFGLHKYLSFDVFKQVHTRLESVVKNHPFLAPVLFITLYIIVVALSIPGAAILTLLGGFLFGIIASLYVAGGATIGACCIFLAAKTALKDLLKKKAGPFLEKMKGGFNKNRVGYLLFLRFIPIFPFWLVNLAPAFFNVTLKTFLWTTAIGILPGTFVYVQAGIGLDHIFDTGKSFSLNSVFNLQIKIALIAVALFCLIPIFVKKLIKKSDPRADR